MKQVNLTDKVYRRGEKLAETLGTTVQELIATLADEAIASLEAQVLDMKKREARAAKNKERGLEAMNLVFAGIDPKDEVTIDPAKVKALEEELEQQRLHNMKVHRQLGRVGSIRLKVA